MGFQPESVVRGVYMLNTRRAEENTAFYSFLACFMNTTTLNMDVSTSYTGLHRRNTLFVFVWLRHGIRELFNT